MIVLQATWTPGCLKKAKELRKVLVCISFETHCIWALRNYFYKPTYKNTAVYFEVYDGFEEAGEMGQPVHALTANLQFLFKIVFYYASIIYLLLCSFNNYADELVE